MIEIPLRTRGYEVDRTRTVPLPVFLSYLEHVRWEWIQDPALGLLPLLHQGHFFVVQRQTVEIVQTVGLSVDVVARGVLDHVGRCQARVRHTVRRADDGALLAQAVVWGLWLGPNRRLSRLPDGMRDYWRAEPAVDIDIGELTPTVGDETTSLIAPATTVYAPLGLDVTLPEGAPPDRAVKHLVTVRPSDTDVFEHVNASVWMSMVEDARHQTTPLTGPARRVSIDYPQEAIIGEQLTVYGWIQDQSFHAQIRRDDQVVCRARVDLASA